MKASREWLNEYADINISTKELGDLLTMTGSKVEVIEEKGKDIKNVVVGKILEIEKHPNADKLVVTKVDVGNEIIQIVTGADNIKVNDIVPIAKDGAHLPNDVKIKKGKLRDIESNGMMCSVGELGLNLADYPNQIEHGIMILDKKYEKDLGKDIVGILNLREDIIEFEITPNRPDCLSIEGLGRETAVTLGQDFKNIHKHLDEIKEENKKELKGLSVEILAPDLCYRYVARVVKNVKIGPSPNWLVRRLRACGIRPINNIVDITNYVMLELGQPMHAFDINNIDSKHICVRRAIEGEKIITLDGQERVLDSDTLVIADNKKVVAIAGVMGGQNSEIEETTTTIVFESACFKGGSVRKSAKRLNLRTESSARFEKGLSPENSLRAVNRAIELVEQLAIGEKVEGVIDIYPTKQEIKEVEFDYENINRFLGLNIKRDEMINIFEKLDFKIEGNRVIPPYFRQDIEMEADLAEEVLRFYGYDKLKTSLIEAETTLGTKTKIQKITDEVKEFLVARGLSEISTYGFINPKDLDKINLESNNLLRDYSIKIKNPLSEEYSIMRPTTIPSMLQILSINYYKKNKDVALFDISRTYKDINNQIKEGNVPIEEMILTIGIYGKEADFYILKGIIENVLEVAGILKYEFFAETKNTSYHPGRCSNICIGKDVIATLGEVHPIVSENYDIGEKVLLAEVSLTKLEKYSKQAKKYKAIPKYPAVERDIAIVVDENIAVSNIEKIINKKSRKVLEEIKLFDIYRNEKLGKNKKSIAYSLMFRDANKTLTDEEINPIMEEIVKALQAEVGANLR